MVALKNNAKILVVSDAWAPQVNGVARCWKTTNKILEDRGDTVKVIHPYIDDVIRFQIPGQPKGEKDAFLPFSTLDKIFRSFKPDALHIATPELPMGIKAKNYAKEYGIPFTSSVHTDIPSFIKSKVKTIGSRLDNISLLNSIMIRAHKDSEVVLPPSPAYADEVRALGLENVHVWGRGCEMDKFFIADDEKKKELRAQHLPAELAEKVENENLPLLTYVGRVSQEKNLEEFLDADVKGVKMIVGPGKEYLEQLKNKYAKDPDVYFAGPQFNQDLADHYAMSDVFVFPSKFETFGQVMTEALASGLPVAAYDVRGPVDIVVNEELGSLRYELKQAINDTLTKIKDGKIEPRKLRAHVEENHDWQKETDKLRSHFKPIDHRSMEEKVSQRPRVHESYEVRALPESKELKVFNFSNVFLSNLYSKYPKLDNTKPFLARLKQINKMQEADETDESHNVIVLNGDFLDLDQSYAWDHGKTPIANMSHLRDAKKFSQTFSSIFKQHKDIFKELNRFLAGSNKSQIIYLPGDHDEAIKYATKERAQLFNKILGCKKDAKPTESDKFIFAEQVTAPELELHIEHGDKYSDYGHASHGDNSWADWMNLNLIRTLKFMNEEFDALRRSYPEEAKTLNNLNAKVMTSRFIREPKDFITYPGFILEKAKDLGASPALETELKIMMKKTYAYFAEQVKSSPKYKRLTGLIPTSVLASAPARNFLAKLVSRLYKDDVASIERQAEAALEKTKADPRQRVFSWGQSHNMTVRKLEHNDKKLGEIPVYSSTAKSFVPWLAKDEDGKFFQVRASDAGVVFRRNLSKDYVNVRYFAAKDGNDKHYKLVTPSQVSKLGL